MNTDHKLDVGYSPKQLNPQGVKRVNNIPVAMVIGVILAFVLLIGMVAVKRAQVRNQPAVTSARDKPVQSSYHMANDVINGRVAGIAPSSIPEVKTTETVEIPVAVIPNPDAAPKPDASPDAPVDMELERIRQDKIRQFEDAVKAKTQISFTLAQAKTDSPPEKEGVGEELEDKLRSLKAQAAAQADLKNPLTLGGEEQESRWALHSTLQTPQSPYELRTGAVIPGVLISAIRSDLKGQIIAQVSQSVYDTATGRHVLIPQGAKLYGLYLSDVNYGQESLLVAWQRIIFPDGKALDIGSMPGTDSAGMAGFRDQVDNHYMRIFGSAVLMSAVVGGITYSQSKNQPNNGSYAQPTAGSVLSEALGQQLGGVTAELLSKNLNIAPTIKIGTGYPFNVMVVKDLVFAKPYWAFDYS